MKTGLDRLPAPGVPPGSSYRLWRRRRTRAAAGALTLAALELTLTLVFSGSIIAAGSASAEPFIAEFMAVNGSTLADGDGDFSDWVEVANPEAAPADLEGWALTDRADEPRRWVFPALVLDAGERRVIFASGKDRRPGDGVGELHTNFKLDGDGEYLALVRPDGTVAAAFAPAFPPQREDIAYGHAPGDAVLLVPEGAAARALVPGDGALGLGWTELGFDDAAWSGGTTGMGYEEGNGYGPLIGLDVGAELFDQGETAYLRVPFNLGADPAEVVGLELRMRYDDGFVAYLNGEQVAAENEPAAPAWDSGATGNNPDGAAVVAEIYDLTGRRDVLRAGANVLAVHGLNQDPDSSDFLILPELEARLSGATSGGERYFTEPTPGEPNSPAGVLGFVGDTAFSHRRGFYDAPFAVEITATGEPDATVRFTVDGSVPTAAHGVVYIGPVAVSTTTVLRAAAFKPGYLPTNVDTQTYLFLDAVARQPAEVEGYPNPVYWLGGSRSNEARHDYEMDPEVVDAPAYRDLIGDALRALPSMSVVADPGEIFGGGGFYDGDDERPVSVEVLYPDEPGASEQAEAGIESHSHLRLKRSLRLNFRAEYGDAKFQTELFARAPYGDGTAPRRFDRIVLRAGNNRSWARVFSKEKTTYAIDEFARRTQLAMSGYGMRGAFVHLYINGLYWGLYNPVERADRWFQAEHFGGDPDDYFVANHSGDVSGDDGRWDYLKGGLKNKDMADPANRAELASHLDLEGFVDYLLLHWYTATGDWPQNNWYGGNRNPSSPLGASPFRFFAWDGEWSWDLPHGSAPNPSYRAWVHPSFESGDSKNSGPAIAQIFNSAKDSPEFLRLLADRAHLHLFNGGVLSEGVARARWEAITGYLRLPVVAESARWGDALEGEGEPLFTRDGHWEAEVAAISGLMAGRAEDLVEALRDEGYYPSVDPPDLAPHGGSFAPGASLAISHPNAAGGTSIRYTVDGSDPADDPGAPTYAGPLPLEREIVVKARVRKAPLLGQTEWSALTTATFFPAAPPALRVTEIMYQPAAPTADEVAAGFASASAFEFIELQNVGATPVPLAGVAFDDGIGFTFGPGAGELAPRAFLVLAGNLAAFAARHPAAPAPAGQFAGDLDNSGEPIRLVTGLGQVIQAFRFDGGWHPSAAGGGHSIVAADPAGPAAAWDTAEGWRPGGQTGGCPGATDNAPPVVEAGPDLDLELPAAADLAGATSDDGLPSGVLESIWSLAAGPAPVDFDDPATPATTAEVTVRDTFTAWAERLGAGGAAGADPNADPDGDGLPLLLEYALGFDPGAANPAGLAAPQLSDGHLRLTFRRPSAGDLTVEAEVADDLAGPWRSGPGETEETVTDDDGAFQTVTVRDLKSLTGIPHRYIRLRVRLR